MKKIEELVNMYWKCVSDENSIIEDFISACREGMTPDEECFKVPKWPDNKSIIGFVGHFTPSDEQSWQENRYEIVYVSRPKQQFIPKFNGIEMCWKVDPISNYKCLSAWNILDEFMSFCPCYDANTEMRMTVDELIKANGSWRA